jgi:hypothetical protein
VKVKKINIFGKQGIRKGLRGHPGLYKNHRKHGITQDKEGRQDNTGPRGLTDVNRTRRTYRGPR